jgi:hypothetical protein
MSAHDQRPAESPAAEAAAGHAPGPVTIDDVLAHVPGKPNGRLRAVFLVLLGAGAITFGLTLAANPLRGWSSVLINVTYWLPLSAAAATLGGVLILVKAKWAVPVHRTFLGIAGFLPWMFGVLALTLIFGNGYLFSWVREPVPAKVAYLNLPFLLAREIGLVGLFTVLALAFVRRIRRLDAGLARGRGREELRARYEKWSKGWRGDAIELESARRVLPRLAAVLTVAYAVVFTMVAWDLVMSLEPHWATTQIAPWLWVGGLLAALAAAAFLSLVVRDAYGLERFFDARRQHLMGQLLFGMTNFRTYLSWVLFLPIWYANLPEETSWMVRRVHFPFFPWLLAAVFFGWFVPLAGFMNLAAKKKTGAFLFFAGSILLGLWIEQLVLAYPALYFTHMPVGVPEIGVSLGFLGGFGLVFQEYAATRPLVALDQIDVLSEAVH